MATRNHYTEEFKRKVVDDYRNGNLTFEGKLSILTSCL